MLKYWNKKCYILLISPCSPLLRAVCSLIEHYGIGVGECVYEHYRKMLPVHVQTMGMFMLVDSTCLQV